MAKLETKIEASIERAIESVDGRIEVVNGLRFDTETWRSEQ